MEINKQNYEEYFLLYTDNELNEQQRIAVELFVNDNPQLREEFESLLQARLSFDTQETGFDKNFLYKTTDNQPAITADNYEHYLLLYTDNELSAEERLSVEAFTEQNKKAEADLTWLQKTVMLPDTNTVFPDKSVLYKKEEGTVVMFGQWRRIMAAASILLLAGLLWINKDAIIKPFQQAESTELAQGKINQKQAGVTDNKTADNNTAIVKNTQATVSSRREVVETNPEVAATTEKTKGPVKNIPGNQLNKVSNNTTVNPENEKLIATVPEHHNTPVTNPAENINAPVKATPDITFNHKEETPVKPYKISQAAFNDGDDKKEENAELNKNKEGIAYLDTETPDEKSKGNFRGLIRKASRFINRNKNSGKEENESVIRIASFAIAKK